MSPLPPKKQQPRIVIIGAGMSGLTAAHHLHTSSPSSSFSLTLLEASSRLGGRILSSSFANDNIELGATWIHGILNSPIHSIASKTSALTSPSPYERMHGFPTNPLTITETGTLVAPHLANSVYSLYKSLMDSAREGGDIVDHKDKDMSVGSYLRNQLQLQLQLQHDNSIFESVFAMHENTERTYTSADDLYQLNLKAESEYREFGGEQITIARGYSSIIQTLASVLPKDSIKLNSRVKQVQWLTPDGQVRVLLHDDTVITADHVIVTVSLGVLKAGKVKFSPELPLFKKEAIGRLGFGVVNKLFMEMDGGDDQFPYLQMAFNGHVASIPKWMRKTASICPIYEGSKVVLAWLAGNEAAEMERLDDDEIISGVHNTLNAFKVDQKANGGGSGCNYGRVVSIKRSSWGSNEFTLGSYSYVAVGSSGDDLDLMAEPLPNKKNGYGVQPLQVLFAGEATHRTHYSTTHGAYFSGIREAGRLLKYYGLVG